MLDRLRSHSFSYQAPVLVCLLAILLLLALAAFPHHDLTMFALGGIAVWCLMPERDPKEKRQSDRS